MLCDLAKTKGKGWSDSYKFRNPTTEKMQEKVLYLERVGDSWVGVGIYK
jgi:cytochrome c